MELPLTRSRADRLKRGLHGAARSRLARVECPQWGQRLRTRPERYSLALLPAYRAGLAIRSITLLKGKVAPRVQAAVLRA